MSSDLAPHLSEPWPAPRVGDDVDQAIDDALNTLAGIRRLSWLGDGPTETHLLAALRYQLHSRILDAIELARDQDIAEADIAHLAGMPLSELQQLLNDPEDDLNHLTQPNIAPRRDRRLPDPPTEGTAST